MNNSARIPENNFNVKKYNPVNTKDNAKYTKCKIFSLSAGLAMVAHSYLVPFVNQGANEYEKAYHKINNMRALTQRNDNTSRTVKGPSFIKLDVESYAKPNEDTSSLEEVIMGRQFKPNIRRMESGINFKGSFSSKERETFFDLGVERIIDNPFIYKKTIESSFNFKGPRNKPLG
jgi:hypothetical protein